MTYLLRTNHGDFEQTRTFSTAADTVAALDTPDASVTTIISVDRMGSLITEADLRRDAQHETERGSTLPFELRLP